MRKIDYSSDPDTISIDEVARRICKSKSYIINAIQNGSFPGSYNANGKRRSIHIPRKAFEDYMTHYHRSVSDDLVNVLIEAYQKEKSHPRFPNRE